MGRAADFISRLNKYGTDIMVYKIPSTTIKCTCWEHGWPDKDCVTCGGTGYVGSIISEIVKAFIFPLRDSDKWIDFINIGVAMGGQIMAYFSPDYDLEGAQYVVWNGMRYKVTGVDRAILQEEMIYRSCHLDKVD